MICGNYCSVDEAILGKNIWFNRNVQTKRFCHLILPYHHLIWLDILSSQTLADDLKPSTVILEQSPTKLIARHIKIIGL